MQRILQANWQHHFISAIAKGHFMINPEIALTLGPQIADLLGKSNIYSKEIQALETIDIKAYSDGGEVDIQEAPSEESRVIVLPVKGVMLKYGTWCSYGMDEIAYYTKYYAQQENVSAIVLDIDSGGGAVNAIPPMLDAIQFTRAQGKPIIAHCDSACSAAYWTASATDRVFVNNDLSSIFGSIGVMISFLDVVPYYEKQGAKFHEVYADQSADKNQAFQQLLKGEYELIKKEMLNPMAIKFQEAVKQSRADKLKADTPGILSGATFDGQKSIDIGLADQFGTLQDAINYADANAWANKN